LLAALGDDTPHPVGIQLPNLVDRIGRTLGLTVGQVNELESRVDLLLSGEDIDFGGGSGSSGLEEKLLELGLKLGSFGDKFDSLSTQASQVELDTRDKVFAEPIELRASSTRSSGRPHGTLSDQFSSLSMLFSRP